MTTTGSTKKTTQSFLHKLVSYDWNGKKVLGFVLGEYKTYSGSYTYNILNQQTQNVHIVYSSYTKIVLEE